jgi:hypothetical protein
MVGDPNKVAAVSTEKLKHPIVNSDRATVVREDGKSATAKGGAPTAAVEKAADKAALAKCG